MGGMYGGYDSTTALWSDACLTRGVDSIGKSLSSVGKATV